MSTLDNLLGPTAGDKKKTSAGVRRSRPSFVRSNHSQGTSSGSLSFIPQHSISDQASCSFLGEESLADSLCYSTATESMMSGFSSTGGSEEFKITLVSPESTQQFRKQCDGYDDGSLASSAASPSMNSVSSATSLSGRPHTVKRSMSNTSVASGGGAATSRPGWRTHRRQNFVFLGGNELTYIDR